MKKTRYISVFSLILALLSVSFSWGFEYVTSWDSLWILVYCDYICAFLAIGLVFVKKKNIKLGLTDAIIRRLSVYIAIINGCWSAFKVIAGLSGM